MRRAVWLVVTLTILSAIPGAAWSQESNEEFQSRLEAVLDRYKGLGGTYKSVGGRFDSVAAFLDIRDAVGNAIKSYEALGGRCDIDLAAANTPRVPSSCAGSEDCGACYEQAQRKLNDTRVTLETLRCIGVRTKAMKDDAIAVGGSFSSLPGMGLGWYAARRDIATGWQGFVEAYDAKYHQLLGSLETALIEIGRCEELHFDEPDWFVRYGFIYHQFMEDSYHPRSVLD